MACILLRKNESASGKQYCGLSGEFEEIGMTKVWCGYYEGNTNGKIVEDGVHRDLIAGNGEYADLWARQTLDPDEDMID